MNIYISQIYIQPGVSYPFSYRFQKFMSEAVTERVSPSEKFVTRYGEDFDLIFRMSAKSEIAETEIKGPTVFKRDKDVEYSIFIPFRGNESDPKTLHDVVITLLNGIVSVLNGLGFDTTTLLDESEALANHIIEDESMTE